MIYQYWKSPLMAAVSPPKTSGITRGLRGDEFFKAFSLLAPFNSLVKPQTHNALIVKPHV